MKKYFILFYGALLPVISYTQSISATYGLGDIPTSHASFDHSCNGPSTVLSVPLPSGGPWQVSGIDIAYSMTAHNGGLMSHQRSFIRCQNSNISESSVYQGLGGVGTYNYSRFGVGIADGQYPGGSVLKFEMMAWRLASGTGCSVNTNKVDSGSWTIVVHYSGAVPVSDGSVGIGTISPAESAILELHSTNQAFLPPRLTTLQRNAIQDPTPGMMIFNTTSQNLEFYTITGWRGLSIVSAPANRLLGGSNVDNAGAIQQTSDGGYIVVGSTNSTNSGTLSGTTNNGGYDGLVIKLDIEGKVQWLRLLGGSSEDRLHSVKQTADGGYILAGYSYSNNSGTLEGLIGNGLSDFWILKLDHGGLIQWQQLLGGSLWDFGTFIETTLDGGFVVIGATESSNSGTLEGLINNGSSDGWIVKLNESGEVQWQKLFGGSSEDVLYSVQQTLDGGLIVAGVSVDGAGSGTLMGLQSYGEYDYWVLKLDTIGNIEWQKLLGGSGGDLAYSIKQAADGGFVVGGMSSSSNSGILAGLTNNGSSDCWILKLDINGGIVWQKLLGGSGDDRVYSIYPTGDSGFILAGVSASSSSGTMTGLVSNGSTDYWVLKMEGSGIVQWQRLFGGIGSDGANSVFQTNDGGFVVAGSSNSSDSGTLSGLVNNGSSDIWIFKIGSSGNLE